MNQPEKVLIFRSGASWIFDRAVSDLNAGEPSPCIDVYSPQAYSAELRDRGEFNDVIDTGWRGIFRKGDITSELLTAFRRRRYDRIVIIYSDIHGDHYEALRLLAFKIQASRVHSFNCNLVWTRLERQSWLRRYVLPRKWFYNVMVVVFCLELVATTFWDRSVYVLKRLLHTSNSFRK